MIRLLYFVACLFFLVPISSVFAQYPTPTACEPITCPQPPYDGCEDDVQDGSFPVCNHGPDGCTAHWSCTDCDDDLAWSRWSGCVNGVEGETRYCIRESCCQDAAEARLCDYSPTGPGDPGDPTATAPPPTNTSSVPQIGDIEVRAVRVDSSDTSCAVIRAVPTTDGQVNGTIHRFPPSSASNPAPRTQVGANYVQFSNITAGSYTVDPAPPTADWAYVRACSRNLDNGTNAEGLSRNLPAGALLRWDIGYTLGTAWVQAQGGDVYSSGAIRSYIPAVTPRVFITDGTGGYPGVLMYGTSVDLDSDPFESGADLISADNWQVNTSRASVNYYDYFYRRFGVYQALTTIPSTIRLLQLILTSS